MPIRNDGQDRQWGRHPRIPGPAADDRHAVRARPGQREVDPRSDELQEEQAAHEHQQVPPAAEDHGQDDHRQTEDGGPPTGTRHVDPVGHIGQPRRSHPRQLAQHPRAGPVINPEPRRVLRGHERTGKNQGRKDQPGGRGHGDRVRQRRRRAGRAALTAALAGGRARRQGGPAVPGGHMPEVAQRTSPPAGISPRERSQLPATSPAFCPAISTRASRARSVPVSSRADTLLSVVSRRGP